VGHDLAERGARALAKVGLADVERRGIVRANHDPRIKLPEVGIDVRPGRLRLDEAGEVRMCRGRDADHQIAGGLDEIASGDAGCGTHAVTSLSGPRRAAMTL